MNIKHFVIIPGYSTQQATEVVESLKNVSRLNLEIEFRFNQKKEEKIIKKIFG